MNWPLNHWFKRAKRTPAKRRRSRVARFESLEPRQMLATWAVDPGWFQDASLEDDSVAEVATVDSGSRIVPWQGEQIEGVADEWIVQVNESARTTSPSDVQAALAPDSFSLKVEHGLGRAGQVLVSTTGASFSEVSSWLAKHPLVSHFEPNQVVRANLAPNDPQFNRLWGLRNDGQTGGTPDADIDATEAWDISTGDRSVVVGVIDTGVDYTHPDLSANIWSNPGEIPHNGVDDDQNGFIDDFHGYDFVNGDGDPLDDHSHGTHVAGTIGATGNNGIGIAGVSQQTQIMALKFLNQFGFGSLDGAIRAINYATMMKEDFGVNVQVTNNSWGGGGFSFALRDAIERSGDAGMLFVASAGNSGLDNDDLPSYPASYNLDNIIAVAASDHNDRIAGFSNFGAESVDLAAPGVGVYSTIPGGGYASFNGTSMASPHVAGTAALAWSVNPHATSAEVKQAVLDSVDAMPPNNPATLTGGRLNAHKVLQAIGGSTAVARPGAIRGGSDGLAHWLLATDEDEFEDIVVRFGFPSDTFLAADIDGSGRDSIGVVRAGNDGLLHWLFDSDGDPYHEVEYIFGLSTDIPVVGDIDGDGIDNIGVIRPGADGLMRWLFDNNGDALHEIEFIYGFSTDTPIVADIDGDGTDNIGVVRAGADSLNHWLFDTDGDMFHEIEYVFGFPSDVVVAGDVDGDGIDNIGVVRAGSDGLNHWLFDTDGDMFHEIEYAFGFPSDQVILGKWAVPDKPPGRTVINETFESGSVSEEWTEFYSSEGRAQVVRGVSHGDGEHSLYFAYRDDEESVKLIDYPHDFDSIYVSYWQLYPGGFDVRALKQSHVFHTTECYQGCVNHQIWGNGQGSTTFIFSDTAVYYEFPMPPGEWVRTEYYIRWNDIGQSNGVYWLRRNGELVVSRDDLLLRDSDEDLANGFWVGGNLSLAGGTPESEIPRHIDDIEVILDPAPHVSELN